MITAKSIINVDKYIEHLSKGEKFYVGTKVDSTENLQEYGIDIKNLKEGECFLPRPVKSSTKYNVKGKILVDKSQKEERVFERSYHIIDWHGKDHYGTCFQSRMCYKRNFLKPLEIELRYLNGLIVSPILENFEKNKDIIKHVINMFLEMFGRCEILTEDFNPKNVKLVKKLPWTILPKGEYPWDRAKEYVGKVLEHTPHKHREVIKNRHEVIANQVPDFMAIGEQAFYGYIIYGFTKKNLYIFESNQPDNATYIFKGNWKDASKLSKAEILGLNLCEERLIHNNNWKDSIEKIIG